jgi:hypothetical protein
LKDAEIGFAEINIQAYKPILVDAPNAIINPKKKHEMGFKKSVRNVSH